MIKGGKNGKNFKGNKPFCPFPLKSISGEIVKCNEFHITIEIATRMNHMYESNNRMKIVYFHSLRFNSDESGIFHQKRNRDRTSIY